ncbi:acid-sensing ion channel 3-like [Mytilus californianus]|uniref:acid-sensing ion channel 3-like n=1 Tax=Mytilus californianus TaxID=6549 RepID=UPI002246C17F|nr:acid-sensing ion channel 3-like [Mytilus californianus]
MIQELENYYNYPTYTTLEEERHFEIEFPAVTICNLNSLSKSLVLNDSRVENYYLSIGPREIFEPFRATPTEFCRESFVDEEQYFSTKCWKECYVRYIHEAYYPICSKYDYFKCARPAKGEFYGNSKMKTGCHCPPACSSTRYEVTLSSSIFPSDFYNDFLLKAVTEVERDFYRKNFIVIHIYFDELKTTIVKQSPVYGSSVEIFGNLGGQMGLFLGASILTITELGEFLGFVLWFIWKKCKNGNRTNFSQEKNVNATLEEM